MRTQLRLLLPLFALLTLTTPTRADVTNPHPGMTLVRHGSSAMVIANLCAPGVSMRATKYAERKATPQGWAEGVGAQAAVNADFFDFPGWSYILVRARGAGEDWPASAQKLEQPSGYWQFGPGISGIQPNSLIAPAAAVTDVVGAYDPLIVGGQPVDQSGNPFMLQSYRRSAVGLSGDRGTVYLYASNGAINGVGMIQELVAMAAEGGAPPIAEATNQDGGGSSQLYVQGYGQVITSGREVNTHLGIYASGSGPSPNCPNQLPNGFLDSVDCDQLVGWAQDRDKPTNAIDVQFTADDVPGGQASAHANVDRSDLCAPLGSCNHGFRHRPPRYLYDGKPHQIHAYGVDATSGTTAELAQSPKAFTCTAPAVKGTKRWIRDLDTFIAWRFNIFADVLPADESAVAALPSGADVPAKPALIHADDGSPEIYLLDENKKRWISSPEVADEWRLDLTSAKIMTAAELKAIPTGTPLPAHPNLVKGAGPAVYLLEDLPAATPAATSPSDPGTGTPETTSPSPNDAEGGCRTTPRSGISWSFVTLLAIAFGFVRRLPGRAK